MTRTSLRNWKTNYAALESVSSIILIHIHSSVKYNRFGAIDSLVCCRRTSEHDIYFRMSECRQYSCHEQRRYKYKLVYINYYVLTKMRAADEKFALVKQDYKQVCCVPLGRLKRKPFTIAKILFQIKLWHFYNAEKSKYYQLCD